MPCRTILPLRPISSSEQRLGELPLVTGGICRAAAACIRRSPTPDCRSLSASSSFDSSITPSGSSGTWSRTNVRNPFSQSATLTLDVVEVAGGAGVEPSLGSTISIGRLAPA